ncbi:MAG: hypothetical protein NVSMB3_10750 [Acidobacteriaceae bacterium]
MESGMGFGWAHVGTSVVASFLASLVECVEALTVVLAGGTVRGWRSALLGAGSAVLVLLAIVAAVGPALTRIPLHSLQLFVGVLLLLFGLRWLRKAVLRSAGLIALHDEEAAFAKSSAAMRSSLRASSGLDRVAFGTSFNIVMLEGTEVVFLVIAIGAGGAGTLLPASLGAVGALVVVIGLGLMLHRPLARVPENALKFTVGVLLSAFGTFWVGEGMGLAWPGEDWSIFALLVGYLLVAFAMVAACRRVAATPARAMEVR